MENQIFIIIIEADGINLIEKIMNKKISVIIRTKNEEKYIGHAIQSILDNFYKPEIIIIDNNSTDKTLQIVRMFLQDNKLSKNKNYTNIKIFKINHYTPGKSLNFGVKKANSSTIMIMSAHCEITKINFNKHIKDLKNYVCIFGNQIPVYFGKKITKRYIWGHFINKSKINMYSNAEKRYFIHNAIALYKKSSLQKKKFNENLQGKEDRYWINEMMKNKKNKFYYDPELEVKHHYTPDGNTWKGIG